MDSRLPWLPDPFRPAALPLLSCFSQTAYDFWVRVLGPQKKRVGDSGPACAAPDLVQNVCSVALVLLPPSFTRETALHCETAARVAGKVPTVLTNATKIKVKAKYHGPWS